MTSNSETLPTTDAQLVERSLQGDDAAYGELVARYQSLVCSVALSRCGDLCLSEDLSQEAFIMAWSKLGELRDRSQFKTWICSIVRNLAVRAGQRERRQMTTDSAIIEASACNATDPLTPDEQAARAEEGQLVWRALGQVPEMYREPMILYYREDQSAARVAEDLGLTESAVRQRLVRGRRLLHEEVERTLAAILAKSKPSAAFTLAVMAGLAAPATKTAAASTAGAAATLGMAKAGAGGVLGIPLLTLLADLPLLRWMYQTALRETRSERERELTRRYLRFNAWALLAFILAAFSSIWWQNFLPDRVWIRGLIIPGMLIAFYIHLLAATVRLNRAVKEIRDKEGTDSPPRPLFRAATPASRTARTYALFLASGLLVVGWPAGLAIMAGDWGAMGGIVIAALAISLIAAGLSLRLPTHAFRCFGIQLPLICLLGIAAIYWRRDVWTPGVEGIVMFFVGIKGMAVTVVVLTMLVWKKTYGKAVEDAPQR